MKGRKLNVVRIIFIMVVSILFWIFVRWTSYAFDSNVYWTDDCGNTMIYKMLFTYPPNSWNCPQWYRTYVTSREEWCIRLSYLLTRNNWDGSVILTWMCYYWWTTRYMGQTPVKIASNGSDCEFIGRSPNLSTVYSSQSYTAQYACNGNVTYKSGNIVLWNDLILVWSTIWTPWFLDEGYSISGAYLDEEMTIPFDIYNEKITWDITIYITLKCDNWYHRNWEYCEINEINYWDGNKLYLTQYGIASPRDIGEMSKEWYIFAWWYSNPKWTIPYDFNTPITENLNLYAKWERCPDWYTAVNNKCRSDDAWVYYEDGYIAITDWENTVYIKDKNQWAGNSLYDVYELEDLYDEYDGCYWYSFAPFVPVEEELKKWSNLAKGGTKNMDDEWDECRPEEDILGDIWDILWIENVDPDYFSDYLLEYEELTYWTYYYRWNNNWATRNQLWINWNSATPSQSVINGWFDGWVMWQDSWWINLENDPCDSSKWEYLPTVEDWKNAIEIWSEIKGYDIDWYDGNDHWYIYYDPSFLNDILVPNAWYIKYEAAAVKEKAVKNISVRNILLSLFASPVMAEYQGSWSYISFYQNPFLWTALNSGHMMWTLHDNEYDYEHIDITKYNYWYNAIAAPVRCFKRTPLEPSSYVAPVEEEEFEVTVWWETYTWVEEKMIVTTNNVVEEIDEIEEQENKVFVWEVKVKFINKENETAKFNKLVQVNVPVSKDNKVIVKVKHAWSNVYNYDWLTRNRNASCDSNWRVVNVKDRYNWETIRVVDGFATIYTCEASSFIALGLWEWEALGEVTLTLTAWENSCTLNDYNLWTHNVSSDDQNVSTSWQNIVCEFLKNPWATIQLSMWDLADWTKEIWRQYFTWIVSPLWNPLWTIANLTWWSYNFLSSHIIYTKEANTIWTWTWSLAIEWIIPAWTPSWEYTWELNIIICEGC